MVVSHFEEQADSHMHCTHTSHDASSKDAIDHIQSVLEEHDDQDTSFSSLGDLMALRTKISEFAAILKEDSPALGFSAVSKQEPFHVEPWQDVGLLASLTKGSVESLGNQVVLLNSLKTSQSLNCMPSKVLDVGLFRHLLNGPSTIEDEEEVFDVDKDVGSGLKHDDTRRTVSVLKPGKELRCGKPRFHKYTDMDISKPRCYADMGIGKAGFPMYVDLHDMLLQCAYAVGLDDTNSAVAIACKVKQQTSPHGGAAERLAHYFVKALYARFAGTGWPLYTGHLNQERPSLRQIMEASMKYTSSCPFAKASHLFVNETVLRVARGASTLHIIEHQMTGLQYPSLFKDLALLPGGPPKVFLVALVVPHYSMLPAQREVIYAALEETGRRLSKCAASYKVPFHFTPWVGLREDMRLLDFVSPKRNPDEVFVFISACVLRFVMDDILDPRPLRKRSVKMLYDVSPDVFIQVVVSGAYSTPFYSIRFKEALSHFACIFDVVDTFLKRDSRDRLVFESEVLGKAILNVVACEGLLVSGRVEKYKQWQELIKEAGMRQLPVDESITCKVEGLLKSWHKDYLAEEDREYLLLGWRGRILYALSRWTTPASLAWQGKL